MERFLVILVMAAALSACSTIKKLNPFGDDDADTAMIDVPAPTQIPSVVQGHPAAHGLSAPKDTPHTPHYTTRVPRLFDQPYHKKRRISTGPIEQEGTVYGLPL